AIEVDTSIGGRRVVEVLQRLVETRGTPTVLITDNGPEFIGRALAFPPRAASNPPDNPIPIVVKGQRHRHHDGGEEHHMEIVAGCRVRALRRQDPGAWDAARRRDECKDPERHGTHPEEVADHVFRQARNEVDDEAEDGALGLDDEPQLLPRLWADEGAHVVGANQRPAPKAATEPTVNPMVEYRSPS